MSIWTYGVQPWEGDCQQIKYKLNSNLSIHNCIITNALFYVSNYTLHTDLRINTVNETVKILYKRFCSRLTKHPDLLISALNSDFIPGNPLCRLKRR